MDWLYPKRRGQAMASISAPPLPLVAVFAIVIFFLSLSQYANYKAQVEQTKMSLQLFFILFPVLVVLVLFIFLNSRRFVVRALRSGRGGASPGGVAVFVVVLLLLVYYQSSFHSKWF